MGIVYVKAFWILRENINAVAMVMLLRKRPRSTRTPGQYGYYNIDTRSYLRLRRSKDKYMLTLLLHIILIFICCSMETKQETE
jgi:hypothetical protein